MVVGAVDHAAKVNRKPVGKVADAREGVLQAVPGVALRARLRVLRPNRLHEPSARGRTNCSEAERQNRPKYRYNKCEQFRGRRKCSSWYSWP